MATNVNSLPPTTNDRFPFFQRHPVGTAVLIFLLYLLISTLCGLAAQRFFPHYQPEFVALLALAILLAITLTGLGWWRTIGFNGPAAWRRLPLGWLPFVIVLGLPFLRGLKPSDGNTLLYLLIGYALTGFMEEGLMRGIVMRVLKPTGAVRSVVISSLLFGLMHVGNLLYRNPVIVMAQMVGAFVHGIGLGAIRLRTNTIWLVVILHGLHDLALKYTNFPVIPLDVVQVTLLMLYGIYLLRTRPARTRKGRPLMPKKGAKVTAAPATPVQEVTEQHEADLGLERLVFFSDAVIAIAITLLALEIRLPAAAGELDNRALLHNLLAIVPSYLGYVISFWVIGSFWLSHHRRFRMIVRYDRNLLLLNMLLLMLIAFIPFPTRVLSEYGNRTATIFYALTMTVTGLVSWSNGFYATQRNRLIAPPLSLQQQQREWLRGLITPTIFLFSIGIAWFDADLAKFTWLLIALVAKLI